MPALAHFFLVRVHSFEPDLSGICLSQADVTWRWWTFDELTATSELILPPGIAGLLGAILGGCVPAAPIDAS